MNDLYIVKGAEFNADRTRRHRLWRIWDTAKPRLIVVGTNPSKADEDDNDPKPRVMPRYAKSMAYQRFTNRPARFRTTVDRR